MAAQKVEIEITAKDKTGAVLKSITDKMNKLRETGARISQIGMMLTGVFTAPLAGLAALLAQNEKLQASLKPIKDAFGAIIAQLAEALIPVIQDLTPSIIAFAKSIGDLVKQFAALTVEQKEGILKWAALAFILGPLIVIVGQMITFVGTLATVVLPLLTKATWAAVAPFAALGLAILAVIELTQMTEFKQLWAMATGGVTEFMTGGNRAAGKAAFIQTSQNMGLLNGSPNTGRGEMIRGLLGASQGGAAAQVINFNYSPAVSTASSYEAQQVLIPMIAQVLRQTGGR